MNEISSSFNQLPGETALSFTSNFNPNERKTVRIFYFGGSIEDIDYLSGNNVTLRMISDKDVNVVSQEKCSNLKSTDYEIIKNTFGFKHQFRIELNDCDYGLELPFKANTIVRNIPVFFENSDGSLSGEFAKLIVW
jgi:hypothetical protein